MVLNTSPFDHPPAGTTSTGHRRHIGVDVGRAIALIGVVVMNYHGMMNYPRLRLTSPGFIENIFDISTGVLTTRFAATFVVIAGISVAFLTRHSVSEANSMTVSGDRIRLLRRGLVLLAVGYFLNQAWPGTIIFFYGAYFIGAALLFHLRTRLLYALTAVIFVSTVGLAVWRRVRLQGGHSTDWLNPAELNSVGDFFLRVFVGYTHPIFPWFGFFCIGIIIGRSWNAITDRSRSLTIMAILIVFGSYLLASISQIAMWRDNAVVYAITSMQPDEKGLLYVTSTAGIAILAILGIDRLASTFRQTLIIQHLQRAGQMTLTLYLLHVLAYYVVVDWTGFITSTGLTAALAVAGVFWVGAIAMSSWWHHRLGQGPAERLYRWLGG